MEREFISLAVIAVVAAVVPLVANRIPNKLVPEAVLLLIAGAVLGPYALNIVGVTDSVHLLSDLGMAFLFLLAGYEIDPKNLTGRIGRTSILTWLVSFVVATGIVFASARTEVGDIGAIAVSIALTTTAIGTLMPILAERGILGTRVGDLVLSFGTYGEIMPILAIALLMTSRAKWVTVVVLLAFAAIAVFVGWRAKGFRRVGNRAYDFMVDRADSGSQTLVRVTVALLVCLVAISAVFHLDIILGAFAAGFVLRYVVPEGNRSLEQKLEAIGYGFLIPLFFVVSGAGIDLTAIGARPVMLVVFIVLLLVVRFVPIVVALEPLPRYARLALARPDFRGVLLHDCPAAHRGRYEHRGGRWCHAAIYGVRHGRRRGGVRVHHAASRICVPTCRRGGLRKS